MESLENWTETNSSSGEMAAACFSVNLFASDSGIHASNVVYLVSSVICVIVGLTGNCLSMAVFSSEAMRRVSCNVYLLLLAISDALYLVSVLLGKTMTFFRCWGIVGESMDIVNHHPFACVFLQYASDLMSDYSTCLILAFTAERCVAVYLPTKFKQICTFRRARFICSAIFAGLLILIAPHHVLFIGLYREAEICAVVEEFEGAFTALYAVESLLFRIIPIAAIAILNVFITTRISVIARTRRNRQTSIHASTASGKRSSETRKKTEFIQLTIMLTIVSTTYIMLHIPVLIHFVLTGMVRTNSMIFSMRVIIISQNYTRSLYLAGFAINFFLYTISGRVFRKQLQHVFLCKVGLCSRNSGTVIV